MAGCSSCRWVDRQTNLDIRSKYLRGGCFSLGYFWTQGDGSEHDGLTGWPSLIERIPSPRTGEQKGFHTRVEDDITGRKTRSQSRAASRQLAPHAERHSSINQSHMVVIHVCLSLTLAWTRSRCGMASTQRTEHFTSKAPPSQAVPYSALTAISKKYILLYPARDSPRIFDIKLKTRPSRGSVLSHTSGLCLML